MQTEHAEIVAVSWHHVSVDRALQQQGVTLAGLSPQEVSSRQAQYGANQLPATARRSDVTRFLLQFHNILIYVLLGCALVTAWLAHWIDTGVILAVVTANALIGFIQEGKSEKAMDAIRHMLAPHASVIRHGERISIPGDQLVPGDIVLLDAGDKVPADLRLLNVHGLFVQEALLTGESIAVEKQCAPVREDVPLAERSCMAFSGTMVTRGQGWGLVVATGSATEIGRISGLLSTVVVLTTPLVQQIAAFAKWLTMLILLIATLLVVYSYFVAYQDFTATFMAIVGLSVAAIPEGLPAVLTITLAVGVQAMAKRNAIVRRLPAIETLGAVSVICSDKTGTLTRNEMMVASVLTEQQSFTLTGDGYAPYGNLMQDGHPITSSGYPVLTELALAATCCNDAALSLREGVWCVEGDPMEGALLAGSAKMALDIQQIQATWHRTDTIPFDAKYRFMATLHHDHEQHAVIFVKGAPERILAMCANQRSTRPGSTAILDEAYWNAQAEAIAGHGQRVLAFASRCINPEHTVLEHRELEGSLTLLGMMGMVDPPRPEAITAVAQCHGAGIRVKMITGDHTITAAAIGKQIGLQYSDRVLSGAELDEMDDAALQQAVLHCDIFARTTPEHKLRLVMALQSQGMTVAMTGDGVNDAPALKRADAGIAMGNMGSEAAKEAADLVLADDNFASIVAAVREGRTVYDNIKKVISWTLPTNAGEAMTIILALLLGLTLPITPIQILWVNLITAVTLGIALAFEPSEDHTMRRPPRPRHEPLLSGELVWHMALVSMLFLCGVYGIYAYAIERGESIALARTLAVNTLVVMEIFHMFFIRNLYGTSLRWQAVKGTRVTWATVSMVILAQLAITYLPVLQTLFNTEAVSCLDGILVIAIGIALFTIIEAEKQLRLRFRRMKGP
ncbi:HAD-IC family P-type ATPase [Aeromonas sp. MdU4]|uniref:HAD-IC family P-type ATPase n=1 Tax=Aeromonas sp. MdU4 TaxID=3342819 RepID=UPI0035BA502C